MPSGAVKPQFTTPLGVPPFIVPLAVPLLVLPPGVPPLLAPGPVGFVFDPGVVQHGDEQLPGGGGVTGGGFGVGELKMTGGSGV